MKMLRALACLSLLVQSVPVLAESGVSDKEIVIGSCSAQSGPAEQLGTKQIAGAKAYLDRVNGAGGVHGRKIKLQVEDDKYEPDGAVVCFKKLVDSQVFAAAFFVGTPTAAKHAPMAEANKLPIVGLFTGAGLLRDPFKRYVINVRASYGDEMRTQVDHLWNDLGMKKFGVIYQDDAFGVAVLEATKKALKAHNAEPIAIGSFQRNTTNVGIAIDPVKAAKPDAVVIVGPYKPVAEVLKQSHAKGWTPQFTTVSFVGTESLIEAAGADADGMLITQVVPPYNRKDLPTVAQYLKDLAKYAPAEKPSFTSLEGYVDAMVLVEGLKRAGKEPTREGLIDAIEGLQDFNLGLGANKLSYGPKDHAGLKELFPTVIKGGEAKAFTDWTKLKL
jgi:branched-chain amino acid transport system substrate-binding protein